MTGPGLWRGMEPETVTASTPEEMHALGQALAVGLSAGDLVVLRGPLGAGKTTLTRGIGERLGVRGPVTSPTFVLARTHPSTVGGPPLVHVDAYRLTSAAELDDLDIDFAGSVVIMEWGAGLVDGLVDGWWDIGIEPLPPARISDNLEAGAHSSGDHEREDEEVEERLVTLRWVEAP